MAGLTSVLPAQRTAAAPCPVSVQQRQPCTNATTATCCSTAASPWTRTAAFTGHCRPGRAAGTAAGRIMDYAEAVARKAYFSRAGARSSAGGRGFYVVSVVRPELPPVRAGPDDHLSSAILSPDRATWAGAQERLLPPYTDQPEACRQHPGGIRAWIPRRLPHRQRPCAGAYQKGGKPGQGRRPADCHRRRLLQSLPRQPPASPATP